VPYMGLFFASYEYLHQHIGGKTLPFGSGDATAGILASIFAKTAVFPLDLIRKRLQVQGPTRSRYVHRNIPEYKGVIRGLASIWRREGYRGWYRGLTVGLVKVCILTVRCVLAVLSDVFCRPRPLQLSPCGLTKECYTRS
jgi:solute carrier family 25 thiamine pyrophosphate transporter 19